MLLGNPLTHDARVQREAATLAAAGHEVTVFATDGAGLPAAEDREGYRVRRVARPEWIGWTGLRRAAPLALWYERYAFLARAVEDARPDVIHGHDLEMLLPAGALAARLAVPHVHDDHEVGLEKLPQLTPEWLAGPKRRATDLATRYLVYRGRIVERRWIPRAAAVITVSEMCGRILRDRYAVDPVILRNLPVRSDLPADPRLRERAGLPASIRVALYQGSITAACAPEACIAAAARFPPGWALIFLGTTWMRPRLEAQVRAAGLENRVRFLDPVPPAELPGFTRAADLGLTPQRILNEAERCGLANKLFEYLHAGLLVITTEGTAQANLVREADAGIVVGEPTASALADAVYALAALPEEERRRRGERLRDLARQRLCWEVEANKLTALYERVSDRTHRDVASRTSR
jgi:glycosyltransferase involved in cell wall biosynthesis